MQLVRHDPVSSGTAQTNTSEEPHERTASDQEIPESSSIRHRRKPLHHLGGDQRLVVEKIDFVVVDKKTNAEITRSILLQVISEQEHQADPMLTQEFMIQVIRCYGSSLQPVVSAHLEQNLKHFLNQQPPIRERAKRSLRMTWARCAPSQRIAKNTPIEMSGRALRPVQFNSGV
jgi:polyhydroxyalkanoate synthesis repressor PhaR